MIITLLLTVTQVSMLPLYSAFLNYYYYYYYYTILQDIQIRDRKCESVNTIERAVPRNAGNMVPTPRKKRNKIDKNL